MCINYPPIEVTFGIYNTKYTHTHFQQHHSSPYKKGVKWPMSNFIALSLSKFLALLKELSFFLKDRCVC